MHRFWFLTCFLFGLFIPLLTAQSAQNESPTSYIDNFSNRFAGGVDTQPYEYPWMVEVIGRWSTCGGAGIVCAGVLISDQWVLTAGDCFTGTCNNGLVSYVELNLGLYDKSVNTTMEPWRQVFNSTEFYYTTNSLPALVKLPQPVSLSAYIKPTSLPLLCDPNRLGETVTVTGWGNVTEGTVLPGPLQKFDDTLVNSRKCNGTELPLEPSSTEIRASGINGKSPSTGCPVNYIRPEDGKSTVIGIYSGRTRIWSECVEVDHPWSYMRVQSSLEWIYNTTGLPNPDPPGTICDNNQVTTSSPLSTPSKAWHVTNPTFSLMLAVCILLCSNELINL